MECIDIYIVYYYICTSSVFYNIVCMYQIIAISNQKGGVGKTTTAMNLAVCMARQGNQVLLIDLDPQANLTKAWGIAEREHNVYSLILGDISHEEAMISLTPHLTPVPQGGLHLLPGSSNFSRYEKLRAGEVNAQFDLKKALAPVRASFEYILLDCPPALGLITVNALACAEQVLVPMEAQLFAMEGLEGICETMKKVREFINPSLALLGVFFVRHNKRNILNKEVAKFIEEQYAGKLLGTAIRENIALREAPHKGKDIFSYAPSSNGAKDYASLTQEIIDRLCNKEKK